MRVPRTALLTLVPLLLSAAVTGAAPRAPQDGATYVGDDTCAACHEEVVLGLQGNLHARIRQFEVQGRNVGCEGCHGPGSLHAEEADPELIRGFGAGLRTDEVCMGCHQVKKLAQWQASTHAIEGVGCLDCHAVHEERKPLDSCVGCHADQVTQFQLPSHHPVREGKMDCASCHDPHSATEAMLNSRQRPADLCYQCHPSVEGPFIFEHPPVQEDCRLCHTPHGSVANNLLVANEPMLCLQCHDFHFHTGYEASQNDEVDVGGIGRENAFGTRSFNIAFTTSCTQCHSRIHGSDLPSQTVSGAGSGLAR